MIPAARGRKTRHRLPVAKTQLMVYFVQNSITSNIKIGFAKDPRNRLPTLQTGCAERLHIIMVLQGDVLAEKRLHAKFDRYRLVGEWFSYSQEIQDFIEEQREACVFKDLDKIITLERRSKGGRVTRVYNDNDYDTVLNIAKAERELILLAAHRFQGNKEMMADALKINVRTLYDKLVAHELDGLDLENVF